MWLRDGARPRFRHGFRAECAQYLFENIILSDSINIIIIMLITAGNTVLYYRIFVVHSNVTWKPGTAAYSRINFEMSHMNSVYVI